MSAHRANLNAHLFVAAMLSIASAKAQGSTYMVSGREAPPSHTLESRVPADAWTEIEKASNRFDHPPAEFGNTLRPGDPDTKYVQSWFVATADKAQLFYTRFPRDAHAGEAKEKEIEALCRALEETYATNEVSRIFIRAAALARDGRMDKAKRLVYCRLAFMTALGHRSLLSADVNVPFELAKLARMADKDFSELGDFHVLHLLAEDSKAEKTRPLFRQLGEVPGMPYGFSYRILSGAPIRLREAVGQPFPLQFTAVDGRNVSAAELKGKIVAIDFWGTAYPECLANVLRLKRLYDEFHAKGLEVIGVNVDHSADTLKKFVSDNKIEWPQYWDGKEAENKIVMQAFVTRAGTILLIDKNGLLQDTRGDEDLGRKVQTLLQK